MTKTREKYNFVTKGDRCDKCDKVFVCLSQLNNFNNIAHIIKWRDNYTCQNCNNKFHHTMILVHHIDENHSNNDSGNMITLCRKCHGIFHKKYEKENNEPEINDDYQYLFLNNLTKELYRQYKYKKPKCDKKWK